MYNGHADVTSLITASGDIEATYYYDAFGNHLETTGNKDNPYRYSGYQYDDGTDLYYLNARYYDSKIARFLTEDTFGGMANDPLSLNRYTYCSNNPVKYKDPTGHIQEDDFDMDGEALAWMLWYTDEYYNATSDIERQIIAANAEEYRQNYYSEVDTYGQFLRKGSRTEYYYDPSLFSAIREAWNEGPLDADTWFAIKANFAPNGWGYKPTNEVAIDDHIAEIEGEVKDSGIDYGSEEKKAEEIRDLATNRAYETTSASYNLSSPDYLDTIEYIRTHLGARTAFQRIMNDINKYEDAFHGQAYSELTELYNLIDRLVAEIGEVDMDMHYFRNVLNRAPKLLSTVLESCKSTSENDEWVLLGPPGSCFHMQGPKGAFNLKFISSDGRFEGVYDIDGNIVTDSTMLGEVNMGTYNYGMPGTDAHTSLDVDPYYKYGNTISSIQKGYNEDTGMPVALEGGIASYAVYTTLKTVPSSKFSNGENPYVYRRNLIKKYDIEEKLISTTYTEVLKKLGYY
jgi:RHS repeat-associated protein